MKIKQYDTVVLKDGRRATVVEVHDGKVFDMDIGSSPKDWDILWGVPISDIERVEESVE